MQDLPLPEKTRISVSLCRDIEVNLQTSRNCGIIDDGITIAPPFWLSGNRIEPKDGYFTVFPNGILNVTAAIAGAEESLHSMTPKFFGKRDVDFEYDPTAQCPRWLKYLEEVQPEEENRLALQMLAGHVISGRKTNAVFILLGEGGTGKSVYAHILRELVGAGNSCAIQLSEMGDRFNAVELTRKRLNLVEELPVMSKKDMADAERLLKMCSDGNTIQVE